MQISSFRDLVVWQKAIELATSVYNLTKNFPKEGVYGIVSQMRRASVSVSSNIAEGSIRGSKKDFQHFLRIASGSVAELQSQIEICKNLSFGNINDYKEVELLAVEINKMIHGLISKLKN